MCMPSNSLNLDYYKLLLETEIVQIQIFTNVAWIFFVKKTSRNQDCHRWDLLQLCYLVYLQQFDKFRIHYKILAVTGNGNAEKNREQTLWKWNIRVALKGQIKINWVKKMWIIITPPSDTQACSLLTNLEYIPNLITGNGNAVNMLKKFVKTHLGNKARERP